MKRVLILLVVLVIYGSLYPWHFEARPLPGGPFAYLFSRWDLPNNPYLVHDIGVNMLLYVPLGFAAHLALTGADLLGPVFLALALSFSIEFAQIYEPGRLASMVDILANTSGATVGVVLGVFFRAVRGSGQPRRINAAFAWLFLAAMAGFRLMPLRFDAVPGDWSWIPFGHLLSGNEEFGLAVLAVKSIGYAAAIWLFRLAGWQGTRATGLVAVVIALVEIVRIYQPHTAPGITDPLIAALAGFTLISLSPETGTRSRSAE